MEEGQNTEAPTPVSAKFSAAMARWVSACMATQDIRYYLNGVQCLPVPEGGVFLCATDGHRMLIAYDKDGTANQEFIFQFSNQAIISCSKTHPSGILTHREEGTYITVEGTRLMVLDQIGKERYIQPGKCLIEGIFPKWESIAPPRDRAQLEAGGDVCVNALYVSSFTKHFPKGRSIVSAATVKFWKRKRAEDGTPNHGGMYLEFSGLPLLGILMPRRDENDKHFWFDAKPVTA